VSELVRFLEWVGGLLRLVADAIFEFLRPY